MDGSITFRPPSRRALRLGTIVVALVALLGAYLVSTSQHAQQLRWRPGSSSHLLAGPR